MSSLYSVAYFEQHSRGRGPNFSLYNKQYIINLLNYNNKTNINIVTIVLVERGPIPFYSTHKYAIAYILIIFIKKLITFYY